MHLGARVVLVMSPRAIQEEVLAPEGAGSRVKMLQALSKDRGGLEWCSLSQG